MSYYLTSDMHAHFIVCASYTWQYAISVTLDHIPDGVHGETMRKVVAALSKTCSATVRYPCAVVSIVGRSLRNALPQIGAAMRVLQGVSVHMVSDCSG